MRLTISGEYAADRHAIHDRVRAEAGNRCVRCGHPQGDRPGAFMLCDDRCTHPRDGKMRILTVHHLTGEKDNNRWWNLVALCQSCHLSVQGRVIPERPWLLEHTDWFKPYVAGFYAFYYGHIETTREDVDRALDHYLAMGQPWLYTDTPAHRLPSLGTSAGVDRVVLPVGGTPSRKAGT